MKLVTFNIRCDYEQDGKNNFTLRKPLILEKLEREQPDVICFQEVLPHVAAWLKQALPAYTAVGCGRGERLDGEQMTVAFRTDRLNLIQMETFWLSETPLVPGSRYPEQSECPRTCTTALLCELATGRVLRVADTHLDHIGVGARTRGLRQILEHLSASALFPHAPIVLAGDFNAEPDGGEMRAFDDFPGYVNAAADVGVTYHGYGQEPPERIDYIWLKGPVACTGVQKWTDERAGVYLSDHYPICAELAWTGEEG
ncbi:MAG: endonuclease/exonuclease/phosphatase family protein [Eubacteriales bacterium]|nr:endonuclease/exonuclease/phosphatase family protein [Eubacteriales bacterium]